MTKRRDRGDGSIYQESNGRWRGSIDLGYTANGHRDRRRVSGRTKTEVRVKLRALQRSVEDGLPADRAAMTVNALLDHQIEVILPSGQPAPTTMDSHRWAHGILRPALGRIRLRDLTPEHIERLLAARPDLSRSSLNRVRVCLAAALREAQRRGWVIRNSAELARTPAGHTKARRAMTIKQASALMAAAANDRLGAAIAVGLTLGPRPGELLGLRWQDVVLDDEPQLTVAWTLTQRAGVPVLGQLKNDWSHRTIALPEVLADLLRAHRRHQNKERLRAGPAWTDLGLVFTTTIGTPIDPANFRRTFHRLCDKAEIGHWTPYEMRHTAITLASQSGMPVDRIADMAGHKDLRMVMTTYRHITGTIPAPTAVANTLLTGT